MTGWRVVRDGATTVALDLEVTGALRLEELARDLVRAVQDLRKSWAGRGRPDRAGDQGRRRGRRRGRRSPRLPARRDPGDQPPQRPQGDGDDARVDLDGQEVRLWLRPVRTGDGGLPR